MIFLRRLFGIGVVVVASFAGGKAVIEGNRARDVAQYYKEQAAFYRDAGLTGCMTREAMELVADERNWGVLEQASPDFCHAAPRAVEWVRFYPQPAKPWVAKDNGWLAAFDAAGCRVHWENAPCGE